MFKATPYLYVSPFFIVFAIVGLFPLAFTAFVSLYDWKLTTQSVDGATFVGLENYKYVLTGNTVFWQSLGNTFSIFLLSTIPQIIAATFIAVLLDRNLRAKTFWRMGVLLPYVVAPVAVAIIFSAIFRDPQNGGLANSVLQLIGLDPIQWKSTRLPSHAVIATMVNFRWTGYNALILLAAMQAVPRELYEAASIDGAGAWKRFVSVTLPSIRGTMFFVVITATMGGLRIFDEARMYDPRPGSVGGPGGVFKTVVLYMYDVGFNGAKGQLGRASAIAWLLFFIILLVTALNFFLSNRIADEGGTAPVRRQTRKKGVLR
jgi:cellobiose transport system permease protein